MDTDLDRIGFRGFHLPPFIIKATKDECDHLAGYCPEFLLIIITIITKIVPSNLIYRWHINFRCSDLSKLRKRKQNTTKVVLQPRRRVFQFSR
jgi:hypothetical protein